MFTHVKKPSRRGFLGWLAALPFVGSLFASKKGQASTAAINTSGCSVLIASGPMVLSDSKGNTWTKVGDRVHYCANPTVGPDHTFAYNGGSLSVSAVRPNEPR